jgi:hypothetical protein
LAGEHLGELVDTMTQVGHRLHQLPPPAGARLLVLVDVLEVAAVAQQLLAPVHLADHGVAHPVDQRQVVGQVGDHGRRCAASSVMPAKVAPPLKSDEHEVEVLEECVTARRDQGPEQFGLAGAGGADAQAVRAHAALRRFLEIEDHRLAVLADADRHPQRGERAQAERGS